MTTCCINRATLQRCQSRLTKWQCSPLITPQSVNSSEKTGANRIGTLLPEYYNILLSEFLEPVDTLGGGEGIGAVALHALGNHFCIAGLCVDTVNAVFTGSKSH